MPYKSDAQRAFFNANRKKLEAQGVDVDEWNASSRGKKLPARATKRAFAPPAPSVASAAGTGTSAGQLAGHLLGKSPVLGGLVGGAGTGGVALLAQLAAAAHLRKMHQQAKPMPAPPMSTAPLRKQSAAEFDPNFKLVYKKHQPLASFAKTISDNTLNPQEANQLLVGMRSVAPHGALDDTRLDWHGWHLKDYQDRADDNHRLTDVRKYLIAPHLQDMQDFAPNKTQHAGDLYSHYSNTASIPSAVGGVAMHELGHAIDFNSFPHDSAFRKHLADFYKHNAPTLWTEHAAWKKGRKGVLDAYAGDKLDPDITYRVLDSGKGAKRVGLGSYWGAGLGSLAGLGLGVAGAIGLGNVTGRAPVALPIATTMLGGALGAAGGTSFGNWLAKNPTKKQTIVRMMAKHLANTKQLDYETARQQVEAQLAAKSKPKLKKESPVQELAKAAALSFSYQQALCG